MPTVRISSVGRHLAFAIFDIDANAARVARALRWSIAALDLEGHVSPILNYAQETVALPLHKKLTGEESLY
jgi:hypothetical protein